MVVLGTDKDSILMEDPIREAVIFVLSYVLPICYVICAVVEAVCVAAEHRTIGFKCLDSRCK